MLIKRTIPALLLGLALVAGCDTLGLGGDNKDNKDDSSTRDDRISRDRTTTRNRDRGGYDGSAMKYPADFDNGIPSGAGLVREVDTNGGVSFKTPHDGKLYVYDVDAKRVIWSGFMRDGERFQIDSNSGRANIDGQSVINRDLNPDHRYRLYFLTGPRDTLDSSSRSSDRLNSDRSNDDLR